MTDPQAEAVQACLDRLRAGDPAARDDLFALASGRLERLARGMLRDFPRVGRWEQTGDVCQNALLRLCRAIEAAVPQTPAEFYRLAAAQVRRELLDLARHHFGPLGGGANHASRPPAAGDAEAPADPGDVTYDPGRVALWTEFHAQAGALPPELREVFDLLWYQGMKQEEAATILGVTTRTVKSRWREARLRLHEALGGELPGA
ncbi:MAG: sigma-70 family RNA polymerase sigma factor [Gemmataceae bacterium]